MNDSPDWHELRAAIDSLRSKGLIRRTLLPCGHEVVELTARGLLAYERMRDHIARRRRCELEARRN